MGSLVHYFAKRVVQSSFAINTSRENGFCKESFAVLQRCQTDGARNSNNDFIGLNSDLIIGISL